MQRFQKIYSKYPMCTVRVVSFICGPWVAAVCLYSIQEFMGKEAYQHMYVPVLAFFGAVHWFFLGKAAMLHVKKDHACFSRKRTFYYRYNIFLRILMTIFAATSIIELFNQ